MRQHLVWKLAFSSRKHSFLSALCFRKNRSHSGEEEVERDNNGGWSMTAKEGGTSVVEEGPVCLRIIRRRGAPLYRESANRGRSTTNWGNSGCDAEIYTPLISEACKLLSWVMGSLFFSPSPPPLFFFITLRKFYSIIPYTCSRE